jgi:alkanesulfonate monooxygenase SsuD/methylene tetrahydromethanopterin reductase-like flavin-dependent oxidoreductase (luciferase family)
VQSPLPIVFGGGGPKRTPALAARFAAEFNRAFASVADFAGSCERVHAACNAIGRDPESIVLSAALVLCCGRDEAEFERRAAAIGRQPEELRANGAAGTVAEVVTTLRKFGSAGATRMYLQVLDLHDLDHIRLVAEEIVPQLSGGSES